MKTQPGSSENPSDSEKGLSGLDAMMEVLKGEPHDHLCAHWKGKRGAELPCTCKLGLVRKHMHEALSDRKEMLGALDKVKKNYARYASKFVATSEPLRGSR